MRLGAIEAGGTKFVCGIGNEQGILEKEASFPTTTPEEVMVRVHAFFQGERLEALGIGTFGPADLSESSSTFGYITTTPKPGWSQFDFVGAIRKRFDVPIGFDTDVNAAVLGEAGWGAARGAANCIYMTVGTGIGAGALVEGRLVHGMLHPEMGHLKVRRHPQDSFAGSCPYHGDCLEGLISGVAIEQRCGRKASELPPDHPVWEWAADYLAQAVCSLIYVLSPHKVVMGGGVMKQPRLLPMIRRRVQQQLNGYIRTPQILSDLVDYIVLPELGDRAGVTGALLLAKNALMKRCE